jgi:hypothetical protein
MRAAQLLLARHTGKPTVKTLRRDYMYLSKLNDAATVLRLLPSCA